MLSRLLVVVATLGLAIGVSPALPAAAAGPDCQRMSQRDASCVITLPVEGSPSAGTQPVSNPQAAGGTKPTCAYLGEPVPCSDPQLGTWSSSGQCYYKKADPQPDAADPVWGGRHPEGAVYDCVGIGSGPYSKVARVWLPGAPADVAMSPQQAAQIVVRRMDLRAADIGIVPEDKPGRIGAVGAPVYMWTTRGPATFGPQVLTGSAGGTTITATAKVDRIVWSMGDGRSVTCRTAGTVYEDRYGFNPSPDCGHRYTRTSAGKPGNAYPITATSYWLVNWTGPGGSSGQIPVTLSSRTTIVVGELQALVTR